jgi:hypothetical protein
VRLWQQKRKEEGGEGRHKDRTWMLLPQGRKLHVREKQECGGKTGAFAQAANTSGEEQTLPLKQQLGDEVDCLR